MSKQGKSHGTAPQPRKRGLLTVADHDQVCPHLPRRTADFLCGVASGKTRLDGEASVPQFFGALRQHALHLFTFPPRSPPCSNR